MGNRLFPNQGVLRHTHTNHRRWLQVTYISHWYCYSSSPKSLPLKNILLVSSIVKNLISISKFTRDNNVIVEFSLRGPVEATEEASRYKYSSSSNHLFSLSMDDDCILLILTTSLEFSTFYVSSLSVSLFSLFSGVRLHYKQLWLGMKWVEWIKADTYDVDSLSSFSYRDGSP